MNGPGAWFIVLAGLGWLIFAGIVIAVAAVVTWDLVGLAYRIF